MSLRLPVLFLCFFLCLLAVAQADPRFDDKVNGPSSSEANGRFDMKVNGHSASQDDIRPTRPIFSKAKERPNVGRPRPNK